MTTRGLKEDDFIKIANIIDVCLKNINNEKIQRELQQEVLKITSKYPLNY